MKANRNNIEAERARHGLSKSEIASKLGVSVKTYHNYTHGSPIPSSKLILMSSLFGCSIDYLLGLPERNRSA